MLYRFAFKVRDQTLRLDLPMSRNDMRIGSKTENYLIQRLEAIDVARIPRLFAFITQDMILARRSIWFDA